MKNFFTGKFRKLSLTQQVMVLILLMIVFLLLFFMFFLSESVTATINKQMYDMLASRQEPVVQAVEVGKNAYNDTELFNYISADPNIRTSVVTPDQSIIVSKTDDPKAQEFLSSLSAQIHDLLTRDRALASSQNGTAADHSGESALLSRNMVRQGVSTFDGTEYYYRLERVDYQGRPTVIVSFMNDTYAGELRSSLMDSTVYITVLVFFLMLMILLFWVFSIIHPLNQIKSYITQIKEGKDVDLYINREDEIGDVAKELRDLTAELAKQEKSKEEMIHNISHDLKTPIATIKSYSESIKDGIYPYGDLESSVDVILDNANRLEQKVHSLLYMNRVEYLISSDAQGVSTNMKDVIEEVVLNAAVIRPEIELITDLEDVYFDGLLEAWRVCIENILQNAFRYAKSYIKIEVHENELKISNDGPKMDESRIQSLFLPYVKGEGGRFGLGLSIVSKVVQANKYKVEGMNTEDGVCFRIYRNVPKSKSSRFKTPSNPVSYLNMQNWGSGKRTSSSSAAKKAAPDQKQKKKKDASKAENRSSGQKAEVKEKPADGAEQKSASSKQNASKSSRRKRKNRSSKHHNRHSGKPVQEKSAQSDKQNQPPKKDQLSVNKDQTDRTDPATMAEKTDQISASVQPEQVEKAVEKQPVSQTPDPEMSISESESAQKPEQMPDSHSTRPDVSAESATASEDQAAEEKRAEVSDSADPASALEDISAVHSDSAGSEPDSKQ